MVRLLQQFYLVFAKTIFAVTIYFLPSLFIAVTIYFFVFLAILVSRLFSLQFLPSLSIFCRHYFCRHYLFFCFFAASVCQHQAVAAAASFLFSYYPLPASIFFACAEGQNSTRFVDAPRISIRGYVCPSCPSIGIGNFHFVRGLFR